MINYENYIDAIFSISENLNNVQNAIIDEYDNPISIDIFISLFDNIINQLQKFSNVYLLYKKNKNFDLNSVRKNINIIIYTIHFMYLYQYDNNQFDYNENTFDFFDDNLENQQKKYFSKDLICDDNLINKLKNYSLLNEKFLVDMLILKINKNITKFDICQTLNFLNNIISKIQVQLKKLIFFFKTLSNNNYKKFYKKIFDHNFIYSDISLEKKHKSILTNHNTKINKKYKDKKKSKNIDKKKKNNKSNNFIVDEITTLIFLCITILIIKCNKIKSLRYY